MNKKGFTLVELLAAITILALLALITVPAVTRPIKESKQDLYDTQLRNFKDAAKSWGADNMFSSLPDKGNCKILPLSALVENGYVEPNVKNSLTGEYFYNQDTQTSNVYIIVTNNGQSNNNKFYYDVWDCDDNKCYSPDSKNKKNLSEITVNCSYFENE